MKYTSGAYTLGIEEAGMLFAVGLSFLLLYRALLHGLIFDGLLRLLQFVCSGQVSWEPSGRRRDKLGNGREAGMKT